MSKHKKVFIGITILGIVVGLRYYYAPYIECFKMKRNFGSIEKWTKYVLKPNSLYWRPKEYGGFNNEKPHILNNNDIIFSSNEVIYVDDGLYIIGCYGVTDWFMWLGIYSRNDISNPNITNSDNAWLYKFICDDSENSSYPVKQNTMPILTHNFFGYTCNSILASPVKIKDGQIYLNVYYGQDYNEVKKITINVLNKKIDL